MIIMAELKIFILTKNKKYSGEWFRSTDPWVMSPVRFHCATPLSHVILSSPGLKKPNNC
jgi:hypothetical protein